MIVCFSNKIYSNPLVSSFFKNIVLFDSSLDVDEIDLVIGWGYKKTSNKARSFASYYNIKYVAIEDAFIRSLGLGVNGACSYGLIIDYSGIYYSEKSDLYDFILNDEYTTEELHLSKKLINFIVDNNISKYNCFNSTLRTDFYSGRVLLVDQTFGDASVTSSGCSIETFKTMLDDALLEYGSKIILKVHPDVLAGKKKSYLFEYAKKRNVEIVAESLNPISLLKQVDSIFTVCSQLGFEALLLGKKVYVYGKPFYAGCGLTIDRSSVVFKKNRSIEELFYSSYIKYCKYFNPFTLESISLETVLFLLKIQMQAFTTISSIERLVGFSSWKRKFIPDFFHMNNDFSFGHYDANKNCAIWASYYFKNNIFREDTKNSIVLVEDGFLRSVGLGVDHNRPYSLVFDTEGIYYDSTKPSKLENIINYQNVTCYERLYAKELISKIIELGFTKYNVGDGFSLNIPGSKEIILVVGQVESDFSINLGSPIIRNNLDLVLKVRETRPNAYIVYKPHPDTLSGGRYSDSDDEIYKVVNMVVKNVSIDSLYTVVSELHTMTSLSGFEALLRGIKVFTYGLPFYAGWGLTNDYIKCNRRTRLIDLEELVIAALVKYPVYIDPISNEFCDPLSFIKNINKLSLKPKRPSLKMRAFRILQKILGIKR